MKNLVYCGPFDAVTAEGLLFKNGVPVSVDDSLADSLLPQDFQIVPPAKDKDNK